MADTQEITETKTVSYTVVVEEVHTEGHVHTEEHHYSSVSKESGVAIGNYENIEELLDGRRDSLNHSESGKSDKESTEVHRDENDNHDSDVEEHQVKHTEVHIEYDRQNDVSDDDDVRRGRDDVDHTVRDSHVYEVPEEVGHVYSEFVEHHDADDERHDDDERDLGFADDHVVEIRKVQVGHVHVEHHNDEHQLDVAHDVVEIRKDDADSDAEVEVIHREERKVLEVVENNEVPDDSIYHQLEMSDEESDREIYEHKKKEEKDEDGESDDEVKRKREHLEHTERVGVVEEIYDDVVLPAEEIRERRDSSSDKEEVTDGSRKVVHEETRVYKKATPATAPSGKFVLRTIRTADAHHVVRQVRGSSSTEDNPETDELVTVLRSTDIKAADDGKRDEESVRREKIQSLITSKLISKFERGFDSEDAFEQNDRPHVEEVISKPNEPYPTTVVKTTAKVHTNVPLSPKSPVSPPGSTNSASFSQPPQQAQRPVKITTTTTTVTTHQGSSTTKVVSNEQLKSPDEGPAVPAWKAEIEMRKKTKAFVQTSKPKEPMKMFEVPEWKRQLQEKNKVKKLNSPEDSAEVIIQKVEIDRLRRDMSANNDADQLPEWARLDDEKKKEASQTDVNGNRH